MIYVIYLSDPKFQIYKASSNALAASACSKFGVSSLYGNKINIERFIVNHPNDYFIVPTFHEVFKHPYNGRRLLVHKNVLGDYLSKTELFHLIERNIEKR